MLFVVAFGAQASRAQEAQQTAQTGPQMMSAAASETATAAQAAPSLYKRLGGYDALAAVSDDFLQRLGADKRLGRFVVGLSVDSQKKLRQHLVDFLCEKTGGPCIYIGREMQTSHTGLTHHRGRLEGRRRRLVATLDKFKVPEKEQRRSGRPRDEPEGRHRRTMKAVSSEQ